jgi:hypothetical protein
MQALESARRAIEQLGLEVPVVRSLPLSLEAQLRLADIPELIRRTQNRSMLSAPTRTRSISGWNACSSPNRAKRISY